jgi:glycosyltransferase involved in cell wall biosynthesis
MKVALSMLCENPGRRTGLTTLFQQFVSHSLRIFPDLHWLLFAGPNQDWTVLDPRIEVVRDFAANDHLRSRLLADHFHVPVVAREKGADVLVTTGFVPMRKCLPTVLQVFSLQHLDRQNQVGFGRALYRSWIMKHSWPKADLIITNSKFAAAQILGVYPQFRDRLVQSYEGLQHDQFCVKPQSDEIARLQERFGLKPDYFLWVSNFYPYKQADLLITAYARLSAELRARHPLVMVGASWEGALERAQALAQTLGVAGDVKFLDWVADEWLAPLYRQSRAFCLASREETFGRCVIEAMACGAACVVNDIPIMHEVTDGHALIVDFKNLDLVVESLTKLARNDVLLEKLRLEGRARAAEFTFERLATERITAMHKLVTARRAGVKFTTKQAGVLEQGAI